jgi:hypothetical protein
VPETLTIPLRSRIVKKSYSLFNGRLSSHQQPASEPATRAKKKLAGWLAGWLAGGSRSAATPPLRPPTTRRRHAPLLLINYYYLLFFVSSSCHGCRQEEEGRRTGAGAIHLLFEYKQTTITDAITNITYFRVEGFPLISSATVLSINSCNLLSMCL